MDIEPVITATLRRWRSTVFDWGPADCMMSVFDHFHDLTGRDPGAEWRGRYHDEAGAVAFLDAAGGGRALLGKAMESIGAMEVQHAVRGDAVCVRIGEHEIAGLHLGDMIAMRLLEGCIEARVRHIGVWRAC